MPSETADGFRFLRELIDSGKVISVIDRRYPLEETAEAHRYVQTGQKKGNVVIIVDQGDPAA
jgi:NADPH:quinone reductase-like Zn-dependent oxidoreductase